MIFGQFVWEAGILLKMINLHNVICVQLWFCKLNYSYILVSELCTFRTHCILFAILFPLFGRLVAVTPLRPKPPPRSVWRGTLTEPDLLRLIGLSHPLSLPFISDLPAFNLFQSLAHSPFTFASEGKSRFVVGGLFISFFAAIQQLFLFLIRERQI